MRERGATDWGGANRKEIQNIEPEKMHLHHIFPFNFMMNDRDATQRARSDGLTPSEYRAMVNDIANITFISTSSNSRISDQAPFVYLPNETTRETRRAHFIPEDRSLWNPDSFPEFLEARSKMIAQAINRLLKPLK